MGKRHLIVLGLTAFILLSIAWISKEYLYFTNYQKYAAEEQEKQAKKNESEQINPSAGQEVKKFILTAEESNIEIKKGITKKLWTFNGSFPGTEIRVVQGDFVEVNVKNNLTEPLSIHWHGYPVKNSMDGVPGLTQDVIKPGEEFTYKFSAIAAGTYWYHSHQESEKQVDKGLLGALIVESNSNIKPDRDYTFIVDESTEKDVSGMDSMNMASGSIEEALKNEDEAMSNSYNIFTINGKSGGLIPAYEVKKGEIVRMRFINAGYRSHGIHIPGQNIKVVATDGQEITIPDIIKDHVIEIAPGERYDIEFMVEGEDGFYIDFHDKNKFNDQIKIPVSVIDGSGIIKNEDKNIVLQNFNLINYGISLEKVYTSETKYNLEYNVELGAKIGSGTLQYTINGKVFSELPPLEIKTGDLVKLTYFNNSNVDHPMHIHGHFFELLEKDGKPFEGARILKDTLLIKPYEKYTVVMKADNPGLWIQHCHELHHAAGGMAQKIIYTNYKKGASQ